MPTSSASTDPSQNQSTMRLTARPATRCRDCLFNSLLESLLALSGIPFAIIGGVLALYVTGLNFSISAAIGFVSLFGVSVMNGILLITYYNQATLHGGTPL